MLLQIENNRIEEILNDVVTWRRYLHRHPELSFEEFKTTEFVYEKLESFGGFELSRPTKTSVVARLIGNQPGPVLAFRADMDALPILEENEFEYVSQNPGVMHACGHDGHIAMLLGVAKIFSQIREKIKGEIRFIFQHAEEKPPGGAIELVNAGVLDGVDMIIGAHLMSNFETGQVIVKGAEIFAGGDIFNITVEGKGGHGGLPHEAVDSITIGAQVITNLQHIVSRNTDPQDSIVLSVTKIVGGSTTNIIPDSVEITGTTRYFANKYREILPELMERTVKGITEAHGASYQFQYQKGYLPVVNDANVSKIVEESGLESVGVKLVKDIRPMTTAEDFSAYLQKVPGCFLLIGARNEKKGIVYPHHHPRFTIDEEALAIGVKTFVQIAANILD